MPAPTLLAGLPKPALFGLYGALGGLIGALAFAEPLWQAVSPPLLPPPGPAVAVTASKDVEVFAGGTNEFAIQVARAGFDGPVGVRFDNLPSGTQIAPITIPKGETNGQARVSARSDAAAGTRPVTVIAEVAVDGRTAVAESLLACTVSNPLRPQADVVFVLDVTGSMQREIDGVRDGVTRFGDELRENRIDFRLGLVAFRDLADRKGQTGDLKSMDFLRFGNDPFTADPSAFRREVSRLEARGGGDEPESSLEALDEASSLSFRPSAVKVLMLITDAPPKVGRQRDPADAVQSTAERLKSRGIDSVHLVCRDEEQGTYRPLLELGGTKNAGRYFELDRVARGAGFDRLLNDFSTRVVEAARAKNPETAQVGQIEQATVKSLQSDRRYAEGTEGRLNLAIGLWTGAISALVCLALLAGQHHYLRGALPRAGGLVSGLLGGLVVGLIGGAAGQGLYSLAPESTGLGVVFRIVGWALLGALAGGGLSLFIPNLKWQHGLAGGAVGGACGAVGFLIASAIVGDFIGRLLGGLLLGLFIGLLVAVAEVAFRRAWLEVRFGVRETITVNLGPEPVKVGGDSRLCTVWARGSEPVALRYFVRNGQVICEDTPARAESIVANGDTREVGNVTVTVRTSAVAASAVPTPSRPSGPPAPAVPRVGATPLELPSFELEPAPSTARPVPPTRAPTVPKPPAPVAATRPAVTSVAAIPTPSSRDPDSCPTCGRKNPGRLGSRYCMVCDQTY